MRGAHEPRVDVLGLAPADLEGVAVRGEPAARRGREPRVDDQLGTCVRRDEDEEIVGQVLALEALGPRGKPGEGQGP